MSIPSTDFSFDPRDPWFAVPELGLEFTIRVFSNDNGYVVDPERVSYAAGRGDATLAVAGFARPGRQQRAAGSATVDVSVADGAASFAIEASHPEGVKAVALLLRGFPIEAIDSGWAAPASPRTGARTGAGGVRFQWTYPSQEWTTPWAALGSDYALSVRDAVVRTKRLHVSRPPYADAHVVELIHHARAGSRGDECAVPEIRLVRGDVDNDLEQHLRFLETSYGLQPFDVRQDAPAWVRDIALVVSLHGQHWTGYVFNTFPQMAAALRRVAGEIEGSRVLAYLPGWEGRYYHDYPHYAPGEELGGAAGFAELVHEAHELGVRVMPMYGAHGVNLRNYPDWERAAIRNDTDRYLALLNAPDWDGDRAGEGDQIFLNPGEAGYLEHLLASLDATVRDYGVDAVFLDTAAFWFDDPRYDQMAGLRELSVRMRERHPDVLVACEGWFDAMLALFPLAQQWLGVDRDFRWPELLTRYARTTGHLAEGAPGRGSTGVHEAGFREAEHVHVPGHIPSISLVDDTLELHWNEVAERCRSAAASV